MPERMVNQRRVGANLDLLPEFNSEFLRALTGPSLAEQGTDQEVNALLAALSPLPLFVFVTRCAMRARFAAFPTLERVDLLEALAQYDASMNDAVAFCLLPEDWETKIQVAVTVMEAATLSSNRVRTIDDALDYFGNGGSFSGPLVELASVAFENLHASIRRFDERQPHLGPEADAASQETVDVRLAVLPELRMLANLGGDKSIDPTEDGPLNGLWPNGAPAGYLKFEGDPDLKLRLRKRSIPSNIPTQEGGQEPSYPHEGQVAEPTDIGMANTLTDVKSTGGNAKAEGLRPLIAPQPRFKPLSDDVWFAQMIERGLLPCVAQAHVTLRKDLPQLLEEGHVDQWVAYHGSERLGFGQTRDELYRQFTSQGIELRELFVRLIEPRMFLKYGVEAA